MIGVIIATIFLAALLAFIFMRKSAWCGCAAQRRRSSSTSTGEKLNFQAIPGPKVSSNSSTAAAAANEIRDAGGLNLYVHKLHEKYGDIVSFMLTGDQNVVSLRGAEKFRQVQRLFDRPKALFAFAEAFITKDSIQFANGELGRRRHALISQSFTFPSAQPRILHCINKVARETIAKLDAELVSSDNGMLLVDVQHHMYEAALKAIVKVAFGNLWSDKEISKFDGLYEKVFFRFESLLSAGGDLAAKYAELIADEKVQHQTREMHGMIRELMSRARSMQTTDLPRDCYLARVLSDDDGDVTGEMSEDEKFADIMTVLVGGFHTTGALLTWFMYHMATNFDKIQHRAAQEVRKVCGEFRREHFNSGATEFVDSENLQQLHYIRCIVKEILRDSTLAPFAARYSPTNDIVIDNKYTVEAGTPIMLSFYSSFEDASVWPEPRVFDPSRFENDNRAPMSPLTFMPFGFAGKRMCPGAHVASIEAIVMMSYILANFEISWPTGADGDNNKPNDIEKFVGLISRPAKAFNVRLQKRN